MTGGVRDGEAGGLGNSGLPRQDLVLWPSNQLRNLVVRRTDRILVLWDAAASLQYSVNEPGFRPAVTSEKGDVGGRAAWFKPMANAVRRF